MLDIFCHNKKFEKTLIGSNLKILLSFWEKKALALFESNI